MKDECNHYINRFDCPMCGPEMRKQAIEKLEIENDNVVDLSRVRKGLKKKAAKKRVYEAAEKLEF